MDMSRERDVADRLRSVCRRLGARGLLLNPLDDPFWKD